MTQPSRFEVKRFRLPFLKEVQVTRKSNGRFDVQFLTQDSGISIELTHNQLKQLYRATKTAVIAERRKTP